MANVATVDKINGDDFMKFRSLFLKNLSAGYNPLFVRIKDIALADFYLKIIVNDDTTLNLKKVANPEAAGQEQGCRTETRSAEKRGDGKAGRKAGIPERHPGQEHRDQPDFAPERHARL